MTGKFFKYMKYSMKLVFSCIKKIYVFLLILIKMWYKLIKVYCFLVYLNAQNPKVNNYPRERELAKTI